MVPVLLGRGAYQVIISMVVFACGRWHILPKLAVYTTYILPSGGLYATYHLLWEPETTIDNTRRYFLRWKHDICSIDCQARDQISNSCMETHLMVDPIFGVEKEES